MPLSVKQLRHDDELGLIRPAEVDPHTGYRYYRRDQARDALSVGLPRSLDVPLPAIARVLAGDGVAETLGEVRARLEADVARRTRMVATLGRMPADGVPDAEARVVVEPSRRVAVVRDADSSERIAELTSGCTGRLLGALARAGQPEPGAAGELARRSVRPGDAPRLVRRRAAHWPRWTASCGRPG